MGSFRESLDLFIDKEIEDSLRDLRKFDKDYDNICKNHAEVSSKYEDNAIATPRMSASTIPTCVPAAEILKTICVTSDSLVAKLFSGTTIDEPSLSKFFWFITVIFASRASDTATLSELTFIVTPRFIIVPVNHDHA